MGGEGKDSPLICDRRGQSCSLLQAGYLCVCPFFSPSLLALLGGGQGVPLGKCEPVCVPRADAHVCTRVCPCTVFLCVYPRFSAYACVHSPHALVPSPAPLPPKGTDDVTESLGLVIGWDEPLRRPPESDPDFVFCRKCSGPQALRSE